MKNPTERRKLLYDRMLAAMTSKESKHQLMHHTDLPVEKVYRMGAGEVFIELADGTTAVFTLHYSELKRGAHPHTG